MIGYYRLMRRETRPADPAEDATVMVVGQGVYRWEWRDAEMHIVA